MILNDITKLNILPEKEIEHEIEDETLLENDIKRIDDAIKDISDNEKNTDTIDKKVKDKKEQKTHDKRIFELSNEKAIFYAHEPKVNVDYDFSYIGNLKKPVFTSYAETTIRKEDTNNEETQETTINYDMLNKIITIQKMDNLLSTKTEYIPQDVRERFDLLKRLSLYDAIIKVNYELNN